jgi:uncharacterized phiE125 gp8 family phage protein
MALVLISGPSLEPITVAEAKVHLRLDSTVEDILIASLILTSRLHIEAALGLALVTQSWRLQLDAWPTGAAVTLPLHPVSSLTSVRTTPPLQLCSTPDHPLELFARVPSGPRSQPPPAVSH